MIKYVNTKPQFSIPADSFFAANRKNALSISLMDTKKMALVFEKTMTNDSDINAEREFLFFERKPIDIYTPFILSEGDIFRPIQSNRAKENYDYYIIKDGLPKKIPNYKTLEVLLNERNQPLESIILLEDSEFKDVILFNNGNLNLPPNVNNNIFPIDEKLEEKIKAAGGGGGGGGGSESEQPQPTEPEIEDKQGEWSPNMELQTLADQFLSLTQTADTADKLLEENKQQMQNVVDMAIADSEESKAQAEAAKAEAEAAKAEAEAAKAEYEAKKAEYESQNESS